MPRCGFSGSIRTLYAPIWADLDNANLVSLGSCFLWHDSGIREVIKEVKVLAKNMRKFSSFWVDNGGGLAIYGQ